MPARKEQETRTRQAKQKPCSAVDNKRRAVQASALAIYTPYINLRFPLIYPSLSN